MSFSHRLRQLLQSDDCAAGEEEFCNNPSLAQKWAIASFFFILVGSAVGTWLRIYILAALYLLGVSFLG
jgi:hypothetical protein